MRHPILTPIRERLEEARDAGLDFDAVWPAAIADTNRWWHQALHETRDEWASAYQRADRTVYLEVLTTVAVEGDAVSYFAHLPAGLPTGGLHHARRQPPRHRAGAPA